MRSQSLREVLVIGCALILALSVACGDGDKGPKCTADSCSGHGVCDDSTGKIVCDCDEGYEGDICDQDINECLSSPCDPNATCTNTEGSFTCACNSGWQGDGVTCTDINECTLGTDNCDVNATCTNTPGSYDCDCNMGYWGDGFNCWPAFNIDLTPLDGTLTEDFPWWTRGYLFTASVDVAMVAYEWKLTLPTDNSIAARLYDSVGTLLASGTVVVGDGTEQWYRSDIPYDLVAGQEYTLAFYIVDPFDGSMPYKEFPTQPFDIPPYMTNVWNRDGSGDVWPTGANVWAPFMRIVGDSDISQCNTIEDFEIGIWPWSPWVVEQAGGTVDAAYAHSGARGIYNVAWHYRTDVLFGTSPGQELSWWVRPDSAIGGRAYLGFASDASGTRSFVIAPNAGDIRFQDNPGYTYTELTTSPQAFTANAWYRAVVVYQGGGMYEGRLYDSDGVTLLNSVTHDYGSQLPGGVAIRLLGGFSADEVVMCEAIGAWFSEFFENGVTPSTQCTAWINFKNSLATSGYARVTMSGEYDTTGITCSDPAIVQQIADALRTGTQGIWLCDGRDWNFCPTHGGDEGALWIDPPSECSGVNCPNPGYIIRPCQGNANWGGVNTTTCGGPSQVMVLRFE